LIYDVMIAGGGHPPLGRSAPDFELLDAARIASRGMR
jgi:hypothetical protein